MTARGGARLPSEYTATIGASVATIWFCCPEPSSPPTANPPTVAATVVTGAIRRQASGSVVSAAATSSAPTGSVPPSVSPSTAAAQNSTTAIDPSTSEGRSRAGSMVRP